MSFRRLALFLLLLAGLALPTRVGARVLLTRRDTLAFLSPAPASVFDASQAQPLDVSFVLTRGDASPPFLNAALVFVLHSLDTAPQDAPPVVVFVATDLAGNPFVNLTLDFPVFVNRTGLLQLTAFATDTVPDASLVGQPFDTFTADVIDVAHVAFTVNGEGGESSSVAVGVDPTSSAEAVAVVETPCGGVTITSFVPTPTVVPANSTTEEVVTVTATEEESTVTATPIVVTGSNTTIVVQEVLNVTLVITVPPPTPTEGEEEGGGVGGLGVTPTFVPPSSGSVTTLITTVFASCTPTPTPVTSASLEERRGLFRRWGFARL